MFLSLLKVAELGNCSWDRWSRFGARVNDPGYNEYIFGVREPALAFGDARLLAF